MIQLAKDKTTEKTPIAQLLGKALDEGIRFVMKAGRLRIGGPKSQAELIHELRERRDELEPLMTPGPGESVCLNKFYVYPYRIWASERLKPCFAMDTETTVIEGPGVPDLVIGTASDGDNHVLIRPADVSRFLKVHTAATIAGHNFPGFDFHVLLKHLRDDVEAQRILWTIADAGRIRDSMLLDNLYQLAKRDTFPKNRNLADVAAYYTDLRVDKTDPARLRYGLVHGLPWHLWPRMFFDYAILDSIVNYEVYAEIAQRTSKVLRQYTIAPELVRTHGQLTEQIQVLASIALRQLENNGLFVDEGYLDRFRKALEEQMDDLLTWLDSEVPGLFKRDKQGRLVISEKTHAPCKSTNRLREVLKEIADELGEEPPRSKKTNVIETGREYWSQFDNWPFIANWIALEETSKLLGFFNNLKTDRIHPRYNVLVRTGRTSSYQPNIQQLPRKGHVREGIIAPKGSSLYATDLQFIELRTLAAVCEARYGFSKLGEIIRDGIDPHRYTAAMLLGTSIEDVGDDGRRRKPSISDSQAVWVRERSSNTLSRLTA